MRVLGGFLALLIWVTASAAHEVRPAIADFSVTDGTLSFTVTLNGEALAGEVSLDGIDNTDALEECAGGRV